MSNFSKMVEELASNYSLKFYTVNTEKGRALFALSETPHPVQTEILRNTLMEHFQRNNIECTARLLQEYSTALTITPIDQRISSRRIDEIVNSAAKEMPGHIDGVMGCINKNAQGEYIFRDAMVLENIGRIVNNILNKFDEAGIAVTCKIEKERNTRVVTMIAIKAEEGFNPGRFESAARSAVSVLKRRQLVPA